MTTDNFSLSTAEPSGNFDSPLLDFWGVGCGYEIKGGTSAKGNPWRRVVFRFIDIDVIATSEPYMESQAEFSLFYNDPTRSAKRREGAGITEWEALSESLRAFYGDASPFDDLWGQQVAGEGAQPAQLGRRMHVVKVKTRLNVPPTPGAAPGSPESKYHDEDALAFKVVEIEGMTPITPIPGWNDGKSNGASAASSETLEDYMLNMANGMHIDAFYEKAIDDPRVMANPLVVTKLSERAWVQEYAGNGKLTVAPDGTLNKA